MEHDVNLMLTDKLKSFWETVLTSRKKRAYSSSAYQAHEVDEGAHDIEDEVEIELVRVGYRTIESDKFDRLFKYCVLVALLLHFALVAAVPYFQHLAQPKSLLRPGEKVTQVRLVEPQDLEKAPEPPPKEASAISDRDHTAAKERLPKIPTAPKAPIGQMEATEQRMASLIPPVAPESPAKPNKENVEKEIPPEDLKKKSTSEKPVNLNRKHDKEQPQDSNRTPGAKRKNIDLRPTPQEIAKGLSQSPGATDFFPEGDVEEAVVDINTREDKFYSYMLHLKKKIEGVWVYPSSAAKSGLGGSLAVEFSIAKDGQLLYVNLLDSSGHTILDESALRAIKSAAPYFPFPPRLQAKKLRIRANFIYVTNNYLRNIM